MSYPRRSIARGQLIKIAPCLLAMAMLVPASVTVSSFAFGQTDTMSTILQKLSARIQKLENSCGDDIKKFCTGVTPGGGHIVYCLEAYEDQISPKCAFELDEAELDLQQIGDMTSTRCDARAKFLDIVATR